MTSRIFFRLAFIAILSLASSGMEKPTQMHELPVTLKFSHSAKSVLSRVCDHFVIDIALVTKSKEELPLLRILKNGVKKALAQQANTDYKLPPLEKDGEDCYSSTPESEVELPDNWFLAWPEYGSESNCLTGTMRFDDETGWPELCSMPVSYTQTLKAISIAVDVVTVGDPIVGEARMLNRMHEKLDDEAKRSFIVKMKNRLTDLAEEGDNLTVAPFFEFTVEPVKEYAGL